MSKKKYSLKKTLIKVLRNVVLVGTPIVLSITPEAYLDVTLGGALAIIYDYFKHR